MSETPKSGVKRDRTSEGETPRPDSKQTKMATGDPDFVSDDLKTQILSIATSVKEIKEGQDGMKRMFESKIDKLRNDVLSTIDEKLRALKSDIDLDIGRESSRIDELVDSVQSLVLRMNQAEQSNNFAQGADIPNSNGDDATATDQARHVPQRAFNIPVNPLENNDVTVIVKNLPQTDDENLMATAQSIIGALGENVSSRVSAVAATRLRPRFHNRPGLVKVSFESLEQKVLVLRNKYKLKDSDNYKRVFLQSAKSHVERLLEINARTILRELPQGRSYRVSGNGRILRRQEAEVAEMDAQQTENTD